MSTLDVVASLFGFFLLLQIVLIGFWVWICHRIVKASDVAHCVIARGLRAWKAQAKKERFFASLKNGESDETE